MKLPPTFRSVASGFCGVVAVFLILGGALLSIGRQAIFDSDFFADHVAESLADQRVSTFIASAVTDALIAENADLVTVRPLIVATAEAVVSSRPFRVLVRSSVSSSHRLVATESGRDIMFSVTDFGVLIRSALATNPVLADMIPLDAVAEVVAVNEGPLTKISHEFLRLGQGVTPNPRTFFWFGVALLITAVLLAADYKMALLRAGIAVTCVAVLIVLALKFGTLIVRRIPADPDFGQALAGIWSSFAAGFWPQALSLAGVGLLITAAATATLERVDLEAVGRWMQGVFIAPKRERVPRLLQSAVFVAAGGLAVVHPRVVADILVVAAGLLGVFIGLRELCRLAIQPEIVVARRETESAVARSQPERRWIRRGLAATAFLLVLFVAAHYLTNPPGTPDRATISDACNGAPELCDRTLDQVVFAATHNAMGAADVPGWLFPNHRFGIRSQLEDGIRAFMIDVSAGVRIDDVVKTELAGGQIAREKFEPALGREGVDAAIRIRNRIVAGRESTRELFLCHGLCELGADALVPMLAEMRMFLVTHPNEVVIIIIEDTAEPAEIAAAFAESRLIDLVYRGSVEPPWPTLREMIDADERVVVFAENNSEGVAWYHSAFEVLQETPYHFTSVADLSCEANRGGDQGALFVINHWITTPPSALPSHAVAMNEYEFLLARARQCARERGLLPNIIAVDFYRIGDLLRVVETLNGTSP